MAGPEAPAAQIAQAIVDFAVNGAFPEDRVSSLAIDSSTSPEAIKALADAKAKLQAEIRTINEETADDVKAWQENAQAVQDDILRSKALASEILKASEAPEVSGTIIHDAETKADFLIRELSYNAQVYEALKRIKTVNQTLDEVEKARDERRILDALLLLERSWKEMDAVPVSKSCRVLRLLDVRAFELKSDVHGVFDRVWDALIHVDIKQHRVSIFRALEGEAMNLEDAVVGLKAYKEVDQRMSRLCHDIDQAILHPRMDISRGQLPTVHVQEGTLQLQGVTDKSAKSLFTDLDRIFSFLVQSLPAELVETVSSTLIPETVQRITTVWLDSVVPSSLKDMDQFQSVIADTKDFCNRLKALGFTNLGPLQDWTESAPRVWLSKCREAALDAVRKKLANGLGESKRVEKLEKEVVSVQDGKQLVANGAVSEEDHEWSAWDDGGDAAEPRSSAEESASKPQEQGADDIVDAWGWGDDGAEEPTEEKPQESKESKGEEDDVVEAWGWGDETGNDDDEANQLQDQPPAAQTGQKTRELVLKELYSISSLPQQVLDLISSVVEDAAALTQETFANSHVASVAAGLFGVPTLVLAMFRAVAPYHYSSQVGGNMYLYNDANYLAEKLAEFAASWKKRDDISPNAQNMLRLDQDIKSLQNFASRAYTNELTLQKTVLRDLLGGEQNLLQQQPPGSFTNTTTASPTAVTAAVAHINTLAASWEPILARSVWQQAVGALADAAASKLVADVMDLTSISQDEAYRIAGLISEVEKIDELFLPSRMYGSSARKGGEEEVPLTAQFAPGSWLRLKYLSEVLQSNLRDVRFLWMEGELSLYFDAEEVVELIKASFEDNPRTREVLREIRANPRPRG